MTRQTEGILVKTRDRFKAMSHCRLSTAEHLFSTGLRSKSPRDAKAAGKQGWCELGFLFLCNTADCLLV